MCWMHLSACFDYCMVLKIRDGTLLSFLALLHFGLFAHKLQTEIIEASPFFIYSLKWPQNGPKWPHPLLPAAAAATAAEMTDTVGLILNLTRMPTKISMLS